ncbi:MAG: DUF1643 domain-containing protein [Pseudomonadota bacterium]
MTDTVRRITTYTGFREAVYSPCERYRYALTVEWDAQKPRLVYVMLNPSKATEQANDPTIERCERRARALGYGAFRVTNLFGLRETSPARLRKARRPKGPANASYIMDAAQWGNDILAAWGVHGAHRTQGAEVEQLLRDGGHRLLCLGLTKEGHPRHPLYVSYATKPELWTKALQ